MKLIMLKRLYVEHKIVIRAVGWLASVKVLLSCDAGYIVSNYAEIMKTSFTLTENNTLYLLLLHTGMAPFPLLSKNNCRALCGYLLIGRVLIHNPAFFYVLCFPNIIIRGHNLCISNNLIL